MNGPYDWEDDFEDEDEYLAYLEWLGDMDAPWESLSPVVERIKAYTSPEQTALEIAAVEAYIERGIEQLEELLSKHAAFDAYLAERGDTSA